jgi:hypothetical protein
MFTHLRKAKKFNEPTARSENYLGKFYDQGDAKWIVIRGRIRPLRGHNDTP